MCLIILENMSEFNFKSSVCTSIEQSERLLALGLKKETADMYLQSVLNDEWSPFIPIAFPYSDRPEEIIAPNVVNVIPSWSLGRLIEMLPSSIQINEYLPTFYEHGFLYLSKESVAYYWEDFDGAARTLKGFCGKGFFSAVVDATEWLIKEEHFNKEYLV